MFHLAQYVSEFLRSQATGRQHRGCIIPQAVTHSLVLLKMFEIIARKMLSCLELLINRFVASSWLSVLFIKPSLCTPWKLYGGVEMQIHLFLTSAIYEGERLASCPY